MNERSRQSKQTTASLAGTFQSSTTLEQTVDQLLRDSGIASEKEVQDFEQLSLRQISIDEVRERQRQLRAMRELMFRQEQKARRIAKIKSKSYRRIHKRERERETEKRLAEEGEDAEELKEEKRMKAEIARARERMTLRHKNTGEWAKRMLSRGQHDLETRQAISEQIRRGDDLEKKILGDESLESGDDSDSGEELEDLVRDPNKWGEEVETTDNAELRKGVMGMKFMRDAEERRRRENAESLKEITATLESGSDEDSPVVNGVSTSEIHPGRKAFTPGDHVEEQSECHPRQKQDEEEVVLRILKNPFHVNNVWKYSITLI